LDHERPATHRAHRWATATLLGTDEAYVWPETLDGIRTKSAATLTSESSIKEQHRFAADLRPARNDPQQRRTGFWRCRDVADDGDPAGHGVLS
jgi:hypothetical protein